MEETHPQCPDSEHTDHLIAADVLLREEPDEEDEDEEEVEEHEGDDEDDEEGDDEGYSD